jgi:cytochrome c5
MIHRRAVLFPAFLSGFAALLFLIPAGSVEARTNLNSATLAKRVFDERSLPSERDLALLQSGAAETPQETPLPEGKGRDITEQKCNMCHKSTVWVKKHYNEDQWTSIMDQMVEKGMKASDEEIATMTSYLVTNFGPAKTDAPATPPPAR